MKKRTHQGGFSLVEVVLTFAILSIATTAMGLVELSNARRSQELKARDVAFARAHGLMERMLRMPFGSDDDPAPTGAQLDRLFGTDEDVRSLSLTQLRLADTDGDGVIDDAPWRFRLAGGEDAGVWEVFVDGDLDGNGAVEAEIDGVPTREGRNDLVRIVIRHEGRVLLRGMRARTTQESEA